MERVCPFLTHEHQVYGPVFCLREKCALWSVSYSVCAFIRISMSTK